MNKPKPTVTSIDPDGFTTDRAPGTWIDGAPQGFVDPAPFAAFRAKLNAGASPLFRALGALRGLPASQYSSEGWPIWDGDPENADGHPATA